MLNVRHRCHRIVARTLFAAALTACGEVHAAAGDEQTLTSTYMPEWRDTDSREFASCYEGVLPSRQAFEAAVRRARRHDRPALEHILECSYSRGCDGAASELYGGELQRLLLAWGDIEFSRALRVARSRHRGQFHHRLFGDRA